MYQKNLFRLNSKSIWRDLGVIFGCIAYMEVGEYALSNYMWSNVKDHVRNYAIMKQQETAIKYQKIASQNRFSKDQSPESQDDNDSLSDD